MSQAIYISEINSHLDGDTETYTDWCPEAGEWRITSLKNIQNRVAVYREYLTDSEIDSMKICRIEIYCLACNEAFKALEG